MPTGAADVCSKGETGSDRRAVKAALLTQNGHRETPSHLAFLWPDQHIVVIETISATSEGIGMSDCPSS